MDVELSIMETNTGKRKLEESSMDSTESLTKTLTNEKTCDAAQTTPKSDA